MADNSVRQTGSASSLRNVVSNGGIGPDPSSDDDLNQWVDSIINQHKHLQFVDRIINKDQYPTLPLGNGMIGTHLMAYSSIGDTPETTQHIVYPSIVYDPSTKALTNLNPDAAFTHAMTTGEYIPFKDPQQAETFSKEYKRYWREP